METTTSLVTTPVTAQSSSYHSTGESSGWSSHWRTLVLGAGIVAAVGLALSQHWLTVAALTPLLFLLPCAVMMFMCMKGMHHDQQTGASQATANADKPAGTGATPG
jgi:hypothetical protein